MKTPTFLLRFSFILESDKIDRLLCNSSREAIKLNLN